MNEPMRSIKLDQKKKINYLFSFFDLIILNKNFILLKKTLK